MAILFQIHDNIANVLTMAYMLGKKKKNTIEKGINRFIIIV